MSDRYVYSLNEEYFMSSDSFSVQEALLLAYQEEDMIAYYDDGCPVYANVYVGKLQPYHASDFLYIDSILSNINDEAYEVNEDLGAEYLADTTTAQEIELKEMMKKTLDEWADKHNLQPKFFSVENVTEWEYEGKGVFTNALTKEEVDIKYV